MMLVTKPILYVECCIRRSTLPLDSLADEVSQWLRAARPGVQLGQSFSDFPGLLNSHVVDFITIGDVVSTSEIDFDSIIWLSNVIIEVDVYELNENEDFRGLLQSSGLSKYFEKHEGDKTAPEINVMNLPNKRLHGIWASLIFEDRIQFRLLNFVIRMISFSLRKPSRHAVIWNRTIVLYGLPGMGKTSLCKALAHQLSIRLGSKFDSFKLFEFDTHSIFSRFYSESGKTVTRLFGAIESMLDDDDATFVCVLIDEVESLASIRQHSNDTNEPQDTLRAVNALLVALDRLRHRPNVIVLCTSNMIEAIDPAFLDRVDTKQYIPAPCPTAKYEILRTSYKELARCGIVSLPVDESEAVGLLDFQNLADESQGGSGTIPPISDGQGPIDNAPQATNTDRLPSYTIMKLRFFDDETSIPRRLWDIVQKSTKLSARMVRRLPMMSLAMYSTHDPCPMKDALVALSKAVEDESEVQAQDSTGSDGRSDRRKRQKMLFA